MRHHPRSFRSGFTMIELLIVIMVIAILMSLLVSAAFSFIVNAREAATAATISKVNGLLQERIRSFRQYDFSDAAQRFAAMNSLTVEVAEVFVRKNRMKQAIPQSFTEADRVRLFPGIAFTSAAGPPVTFSFTSPATGYLATYESGIVLYAFLTRGETFGAPSAADDAFTGSEVRIGPETNNLPCLVDAWGEPLRFYRWPTRLFRCGEQDFYGGGSSDYNQNGTPESVGGITPGVFPPASGTPIVISPIIRPIASIAVLSGPTPASLLISNLPPFDRNSSYAFGSDGAPGAFDIDDDGNSRTDWTGSTPDPGEVGYPDSDDPESLNTDPDDPSNRLSNWLQTVSNQTIFLSAFHDFYTFHTPLVVSSGPDKQLGLFEPTDITNFGHLAAPKLPPTQTTVATMSQLSDNITNLNQRTGGK